MEYLALQKEKREKERERDYGRQKRRGLSNLLFVQLMHN
jgi:hypothetical protein